MYSTQRTPRTQRKTSFSMTPNDTAYAVIGAAIRVHTALGAGVLESTYDACFYYELTKAGLRFQHQVHLPVVYEGVQLSTANEWISSSRIASSLSSNASRWSSLFIVPSSCPISN